MSYSQQFQLSHSCTLHPKISLEHKECPMTRTNHPSGDLLWIKSAKWSKAWFYHQGLFQQLGGVLDSLWASSSVFAAFTSLPTTHVLASIAMMLWNRHLLFLLGPYRTQFATPAPTVMACFLTPLIGFFSFLTSPFSSATRDFPATTSPLNFLIGGPPLERVIRGSHRWGSTLELD